MIQNVPLTLPCDHHWLVFKDFFFSFTEVKNTSVSLKDASKDVQKNTDKLVQDIEDIKHSLAHMQVCNLL